MVLTQKVKTSLAVITGLLMTLFAMMSTAAFGAPTVDEDTGSLTVHKLAQPTDKGDPGTGMEDPTVQGEGIPDIEFQVQKVNEVNLQDNAGWVDAQAIVEQWNIDNTLPNIDEGVPFTLADPITQSTTADGTATFDALPVGLYLVTENLTEAQKETLSGIDSFWVTVPMTNPENLNEWVYDVHVYPKNTVNSAVKSVTDADTVAVGETVEFVIETSIPGGLDVIDSYSIVDQLSENLTFQDASATVDGEAVVAENMSVENQEGELTISFNQAAGDQFISALAANPQATVMTTITAVVNAPGEITNQATFFPTVDSSGVPTNEVVTKFGGVSVNKVNSDSENLSGAVFEIYSSHTDNFADATLVSIDGQTQFTTTDGVVNIDGLRYSDFANGKTVSAGDPEYNYYWLKEVQAPSGYELLSQPVPFTVTAPMATADAIEVVNVPTNAGGELPFTGGAGLGILVAGGALIILGSTVVYRTHKKATN